MKVIRETRIITPEDAKDLLRRNTRNRKLRNSIVDRYALDMREGRWAYTGDAIKFSEDELLDGQHRLAACIKAGVAFKTDVIWNLDPSCREAIDCGFKRTPTDILQIEGFQVAGDVGALCRLIAAYRRTGRIDAAVHLPPVSNPELIEVAASEDLDLLLESARAGRLWQGVKYSRALMSFAYWLFRQTWPKDTVDQFWRKLSDGVGLDMDDPAYQLREKIRAEYRHLSDRKYTMALIIKAFNAYIRGQKIRCFRLGAKEAFPSIITREEGPR